MLDMGNWTSGDLTEIPRDLIGLVALADLSAVARRTALTGTSSITDALMLCPGFHRQQDAPNLSNGDYPVCAAMTTGYVFRIENEATVLYMQTVGRSGHLTTLKVSNDEVKRMPLRVRLGKLLALDATSKVSVIAYYLGVVLSVLSLVLCILFEDKFGTAFIGVLMLARLTNLIVVRRRAFLGWKGQSEPDAKSDLIVLLSQDRWIRLQGPTDDVKAVTSGQWLREPTSIESALVAFATLTVYLAVTLAANANHAGKVVLIVLLCFSAGLLGLANENTRSLQMYGRTITPTGRPRPYKRRLELTEELVKESGRGDWAIAIGMANRDDVERFLPPAKLEVPASIRHRGKSPRREASSEDLADGRVTV